EGGGQRPQRLCSRPQGQHIPELFALAPHRWQQASVDQRGLTASGSAHYHHERMLAHLADQLPDGAVRIICAAAAEEERCILLAEGLEPPVRADGLPHYICRRGRAVDGRQKACNLVGRVGHSRDEGEIDPGEKLEKTYRRIACLGQDYRYE